MLCLTIGKVMTVSMCTRKMEKRLYSHQANLASTDTIMAKTTFVLPKLSKITKDSTPNGRLTRGGWPKNCIMLCVHRRHRIVQLNMIKNCPITEDDIVVAKKIFGKDIAALKGKATRTAPIPVKTEVVAVPKALKQQH